MQLLHQFIDEAGYRGGVVSIGNFDGVHRGHRVLLATLIDRAKTLGVPSVVFTFDPHPIAILRPEHAPPSLSTIRRKAELLGQCGVDYVIAYPTDRALLNLTPEEFYQQIISQQLAASGLVEGPNFYFGHNRAGDIHLLQKLCAADQRRVDIVEPANQGDDFISSSRIRSHIIVGELEQAVEMLGHPYQITGLVIPGQSRGRTLGFPTANLHNIDTLLPADGVYAAIVNLAGQSYPAAVNVGANPTFQDESSKFEVHLIGFDGDLYGQSIDVDLIARIRDTISFSSADSLQVQLRKDIQAAGEIARSNLGRES